MKRAAELFAGSPFGRLRLGRIFVLRIKSPDWRACAERSRSFIVGEDTKGPTVVDPFDFH
jgi:hypothetical protein